MMIDFSKIVELVPDGGRLILTFTARADRKQNGDEGTKEVVSCSLYVVHDIERIMATKKICCDASPLPEWAWSRNPICFT